MLGTIVNTCTILTGSVIGSVVRKGIKEEYQGALFNAMGLAAVALGGNSVVQNMPKSKFPVLFILSLAAGSLLGTVLDLDGRFQRLVSGHLGGGQSCGRGVKTVREDRAQSREAGQTDSGRGRGAAQTEGGLGQGLATAILLFCIGSLSILGPIQSAVNGDNTFLFTNATLDFVTSMVLASTYGIGIAIAAAVLFCWQGAIYLGAGFLSGFLTPELLAEVSIVGGILIASSGLSILKIKDCRTLNMLPSLLGSVVWFLVKGVFGF